MGNVASPSIFTPHIFSFLFRLSSCFLPFSLFISFLSLCLSVLILLSPVLHFLASLSAITRCLGLCWLASSLPVRDVFWCILNSKEPRPGATFWLFVRPYRTQNMGMRPTVTDVAWSVCLSVSADHNRELCFT